VHGSATILARIARVLDRLDRLEEARKRYMDAAGLFAETRDDLSERDARYDAGSLSKEMGDLPQSIIEMKRVIELDQLLHDDCLAEDLEILKGLEIEIQGLGDDSPTVG
jgi:tetratricopeptide (TPR) repeat protein